MASCTQLSNATQKRLPRVALAFTMFHFIDSIVPAVDWSFLLWNIKSLWCRRRPTLPRGRHDRVEAVPGGSRRVRESLQKRRQRLPIGRSVRHQQVALGAGQRRRRAHRRGILQCEYFIDVYTCSSSSVIILQLVFKLKPIQRFCVCPAVVAAAAFFFLRSFFVSARALSRQQAHTSAARSVGG